MKGESNAFLIYQDDNGVSNVNVRFEGEDVWLTAEQLQQLFQASQQDVSHHIQQIYADGELLAEATNKKYEASCITVGLFDTDSGVKRCEHGAQSAECLQRAA